MLYELLSLSAYWLAEGGSDQKLMDISYEKRQISNEANAIIREYIEKYEIDLKLLDKEAADMLIDFIHLITLQSGFSLDLIIALTEPVIDLEKEAPMMEEKIISKRRGTRYAY